MKQDPGTDRGLPLPARVGIYAGTFDPVHQGHLAFARAAALECRLGTVVFLPERLPRSKQRVTDMSHRVALLEAAIADDPNLAVLALDSSQFVVAHTLPLLHAHYPDSELVFLFGSDVICGSFAKWPGLNVLLGQATLAVGIRSEHSREQAQATLERISRELQIEARYAFVEADYAHVSSTHARSSKGKAEHLHDTSHLYIRRHGLYGR